MSRFSDLLEIFSTLLGPNGCPWDLKQTMHTIRSDLLEECHEVLEAIALDDNEAMCEELGDLLAVIVFLGKLAEKEGRFSLETVISGVCEKLVRRHPHVFDRASVEGDEALWQQWDRIKKMEKGKENRTSVLDGIPPELPALARVQKIQKKIEQSGLDWQSRDSGGSEPELRVGEELWAVVQRARKLELDAEQALRRLAAHREREFRACETDLASV